MTTAPDNVRSQIADEQRRRLDTADALVGLDNYGQRQAMPVHVRTTLTDVLRPVCDNNNRLSTLMHEILNTEDEPPSAIWTRLRAQWLNEDREQLWKVRIEVQAPGLTAREAAEHAWDALVHDAPPRVEVWAATGDYLTAVTIDLDEQRTGDDT